MEVEAAVRVRRVVRVAVHVIPGYVGTGGGDGIVFARWESPTAPLLRVVTFDDARQERGARLRGRLVRSALGARGVEVGPVHRVRRIGPIRDVLGAKAGRSVDQFFGRTVLVDDKVLDVVHVVAQVGPRFAVGVVGQGVVDRGDAFRSVQVGHVGAEMPKVVGAEARVPTQFLPCVCRVEEGPTDREGNGLCEVAVVS